jgi:hypothetical protein
MGETEVEGRQGIVEFLGVAADRRLLDEDLSTLPDAEQQLVPAAAGPHRHGRLVTAGSVLTGGTLIGGTLLFAYGAWQAVIDGSGGLNIVLAVIGLLLAVTHWGWVHVAEYAGLTMDAREQRRRDALRQEWLDTIEPYPRYSISTSVLADASTRIQRVLHQPVLTPQHTFTFVRRTDAETILGADTSAEVLAATAESMRRQARLESDRLHALWQTASTAYAAALASDRDDQRQLAGQRAAAVALSEHINASLREPPVVE